MKLLIENWREYLNEDEEREFGPDVQRIHDYYNSDKVMDSELSQSELSGSEVFELAYKLSRMEAEQSVALVYSLGYSPLTTKVIMRAVAGLLIAEESDLKTKWKAIWTPTSSPWTRSGSNPTEYEIESLRAARARNQVNVREFLTIWLKKEDLIKKEKGDE